MLQVVLTVQLGKSPVSTFATGVLTLDTGGTITQSGVINLSAAGSGLILRDASSVTLNSANSLTNLAATSIGGAISVTNGAANTLNVANLTDDLGAVNGISTSGNVALTNSAGAIAETGGVIINGATLTTSSVGGTTLTMPIRTSFSAANSTSGDIALTNTAAPLTITGISQ